MPQKSGAGPDRCDADPAGRPGNSGRDRSSVLGAIVDGLIAGVELRRSVPSGIRLEVALSPCLATRSVAANPPADGHERENQKRQDEQAECHRERDVGSWSEADLSHLPRGYEALGGRVSQRAVMVVT